MFGAIASRRRFRVIGDVDVDADAGERFPRPRPRPRPRPPPGALPSGVNVTPGPGENVGVVGLVVDLERVERDGDGEGFDSDNSEDDDRDRVIGGVKYESSLVGETACLLRFDFSGVCGISSLSILPDLRFIDSCAAVSDASPFGQGLSGMCMNWLRLPLKLVILSAGTSPGPSGVTILLDVV